MSGCCLAGTAVTGDGLGQTGLMAKRQRCHSFSSGERGSTEGPSPGCKIQIESLGTPVEAVFLGDSFFGSFREAHHSCSSHSLYLCSPVAGAPPFAPRDGSVVGHLCLDPSSGPILQAMKEPLHLGNISFSCLTSCLFLPRGGEHLSFFPEPVSPPHQEEWKRGLMEASPYFGSFLLVE